MDTIFTMIGDYGLAKIYPFFVIMLLRPFGMMLGFFAFTWVFRSALLVRMAIAAAIALPMIASNAQAVEEVALSSNIYLLAPISMKEFALGYGIGFLASLPFLALQYAGSITDQFRGEFESGMQDPTGGQLHTTSQAYLVIGFFAFFSFNGVWGLVENLYRSYGVWPIGYLFPALTLSAGAQAVDLMTTTLRSAISVALPLLALLVVVEFAVAVGSRIASRFRIYELSFPLRNLAFVVASPAIVWVVWHLSGDIHDRSANSLSILERFFE